MVEPRREPNAEEMGDPQGAVGEKATASSPSAAGLADCSEAVCAALRQLQEGYAAAQVRVQELQVGLGPELCRCAVWSTSEHQSFTLLPTSFIFCCIYIIHCSLPTAFILYRSRKRLSRLTRGAWRSTCLASCRPPSNERRSWQRR